MKTHLYLSLLCWLLTGCGGTYTKFDHPLPASESASADAECPDGIDYKTGTCR